MTAADRVRRALATDSLQPGAGIRVSVRLRMHDSTLRKLLKAEGTKVIAIVDEVRAQRLEAILDSKGFQPTKRVFEAVGAKSVESFWKWHLRYYGFTYRTRRNRQ